MLPLHSDWKSQVLSDAQVKPVHTAIADAYLLESNQQLNSKGLAGFFDSLLGNRLFFLRLAANIIYMHRKVLLKWNLVLRSSSFRQSVANGSLIIYLFPILLASLYANFVS